MFNGKFICTLIAIIVAVLAICNLNTNSIKSIEGLGMLPSFKPKPIKVAALSAAGAAKGDWTQLSGIYTATSPGLASCSGLQNGQQPVVGSARAFKGQQFYQNPQFQASLSPRFFNSQLGSNIRYNPPPERYQAVPCNPLTYGKMAQKSSHTKEGFCGSCSGSSTSCSRDAAGFSYAASPGTGTPLLEGAYANGNFNSVTEQVKNNSGVVVGDTLPFPVNDMTVMDAEGVMTQPVVFNRLIYANRNSILRGQGDPIRGDLAITPCNTGWFQVSVNPTIDLQQGAMNVLGGFDNSNAKAMAALFNNATGETAIGGTNLTQQELISVGAGLNDVSVTAFP